MVLAALRRGELKLKGISSLSTEPLRNGAFGLIFDLAPQVALPERSLEMGTLGLSTGWLALLELGLRFASPSGRIGY